MFVYLNETERVSKNKITFSAEAVLEVEANETFEAPVPAIWDKQILGSVDIDQYDIY